MAGQHTENLFRRFKGEKVNLKTISGGIYEGRVAEITNDYVCLTQTSGETSGSDSQPVFIFFTAIESVAANVLNE
jgi:ribosome maturation factor RimP